jgi:CDP-diacylglycerol pyrophosphatase
MTDEAYNSLSEWRALASRLREKKYMGLAILAEAMTSGGVFSELSPERAAAWQAIHQAMTDNDLIAAWQAIQLEGGKDIAGYYSQGIAVYK